MKNKEILPFVTRMTFGGIMLREVSQTEEDTCYVISLYVWYLAAELGGWMGQCWSKDMNFQLQMNKC